MDGCAQVLDAWMDGWLGGWMEGWVEGWMHGWMDGWISKFTFIFKVTIMVLQASWVIGSGDAGQSCSKVCENVWRIED